jgi:signal transduction histidine kinase
MIDATSIANLQMLMNVGDGRQAVLNELFAAPTAPVGDNAAAPRSFSRPDPRKRSGKRAVRLRVIAPKAEIPSADPHLPEAIILALDQMSAEDRRPVRRFAEGLAYHYNNLFMAVVGNLSIVMHYIGPTHPAYKGFRTCEELIHNSALLIRLLVDVFNRPQSKGLTLYPIDLSDREIGKRIFAESLTSPRQLPQDRHTEQADLILKMVAGSMGQRLKQVMQTLQYRTEQLFRLHRMTKRYRGYHRRIIFHLRDGIRLSEALRHYAGRFEIKRQCFDLSTTICRVIENFQACFAKIDFALDLPQEAVMLRGDEQLLQNVLLELIGNAYNAMPLDSRVLIRARIFRAPPSSADYCGKKAAGSACLNLIVQNEMHRDRPDFDQERLTEPFYRSVQRVKGHGMGLAVVSQVVRRHGGQMQIRLGPKRFSLRIQLPAVF